MNLPESTSAVEASNRFSFSTLPTFLFIRDLLPYQKTKAYLSLVLRLVVCHYLGDTQKATISNIAI